jgi:hypothetical protein
MKAIKKINGEPAFHDFESFKAFVMSIPVNEKIELRGWRYKWMKIEQEKDGGYSWTMEHNFKVSGFVGYVYPSQGHYVQNFKTENGARRNLINRCEWFF